LFFLLSAALNAVAVALFVNGYRARTLEGVRRAERLALGCAVITLFQGALIVACFLVLFVDSPGVIAGFIAIPALLPFAAWLGLGKLRRSRAAA
jgi:hypothetical protein